MIVLVLFLPISTTYLVDAALYFSDDEETISINSNNMHDTDIRYVESGEGQYAACRHFGNWDAGQNPTTRCSEKPSSSANYFNGSFRSILPGCAFNTATTASERTCGDDGYNITQNTTHALTGQEVFSSLFFEFQDDHAEICSNSLFGNSYVDYTITIDYWSLDNIPTNFSFIGNYYREDSVIIDGTSYFNSGQRTNTGTWTAGVDFCRATISVEHYLDLSELSQIAGLLESFYASNDVHKSVWISIELDNLRTEGGREWESIGYINPFSGTESFDVYHYYEFQTSEINAINASLRFGIFGLGIVLWAVAIASTPFWDPIKSRIDKARNNS